MLGALRQARERKQMVAGLSERDIPPFPELLWKILSQLRDPEATLESIGSQLTLDPSLSARLLRTVNSAAFGLRQPVTTPTHATAMLGREHVECIVLALGVNQALPGDSVRGFQPYQFWKQAAFRASTARALTSIVAPAFGAFNFTASLLQDMAVPLLAHFGPDSYGDVLEEWHTRHGSLDKLEHSEFGWSHADVGSWMAEAWAFPTPLVSAITHHHGSLEDLDPQLAPTNLVAGLRVDSSDMAIEMLVETIHEAYNLPPELVTQLLTSAREEADELAAAISA